MILGDVQQSGRARCAHPDAEVPVGGLNPSANYRGLNRDTAARQILLLSSLDAAIKTFGAAAI